jgi:hypothetical protein
MRQIVCIALCYITHTHTRAHDIEKCAIVWLDEYIGRDESGETVNHFRRIVVQAQTFSDPNDWIDDVTDILHQRVFFVLSVSTATMILLLDIHQIERDLILFDLITTGRNGRTHARILHRKSISTCIDRRIRT